MQNLLFSVVPYIPYPIPRDHNIRNNQAISNIVLDITSLHDLTISHPRSTTKHPKMSTTTFLLAILAILPQTLTSPLAPRRWGHEIDYGVLTSSYTPGFVGERPITGPDGDYLRTTHCYCKSAYDGMPDSLKPHTNITVPGDKATAKRQVLSTGNGDGQHSGGGHGIQPGEILQGHYWRYEYYNYHNNATYFMNHYCMEDAFPQDKYGCGYDGPGHFQPSPESHFNSATFNDWSFTYSPIPGHAKHSWIIYKKQTDLDWIMYGRGEMLKMQKRRLGTNQGLIIMPREFVDETCTRYCDEELVLPMDQSIKSHAEVYNDIDDMCDRCE